MGNPSRFPRSTGEPSLHVCVAFLIVSMYDHVRSRLPIWVLARKTDSERNLNSSVAFTPVFPLRVIFSDFILGKWAEK